MDEKTFIAFECPNCEGFVTDVPAPVARVHCPHCDLSMFTSFSNIIPCLYYPCLHISDTSIQYSFRDSFGYAEKNLINNQYKEKIGYYIEGHEKEFFKIKAEKDLTLERPKNFTGRDIVKSPNDLSQIIKEVTDYIESTNSDKYGDSPLDDMLGPDGKAINTFQIKKYLTRYKTTGFKKSELRSDLLKIIHYAMFELLRIKK